MSASLQNYIPIVLAGLTGSGKTEILHLLKQLDEQVLDLEALAQTDGSVFSSLKYTHQPSAYQLHKAIEKQFAAFSHFKPVFVERESGRLGKRLLPHSIIAWLKNGVNIILESPLPVRMDRIYNSYIKENPLKFMESVLALESKMDRGQYLRCFEHLGKKEYYKAIELLLDHYDAQPGYAPPSGHTLTSININQLELKDAARIIIKESNRYCATILKRSLEGCE